MKQLLSKIILSTWNGQQKKHLIYGKLALFPFLGALFLIKQWTVTVITPKGGWLAQECESNSVPVNLVIYDYMKIISEEKKYVILWAEAIKKCDVVLCTVHPGIKKFKKLVTAVASSPKPTW